MSALTLSYSLADQAFERTKSLGILNLSVQLLEQLARSDAFRQFAVFSNSLLDSRLHLPARVTTRHFDRAADSRLGRILWDQWHCYAAARASGNDWLFLPKGFASFARKPRVKVAAYVHDAMHDFYARRFPDAMPAFEQWYFQKSLTATLRDADVIFTNSDFTRTEVLRLTQEWRLPEPRVLVAGIGFAASKAMVQEQLNRVVVLVGRVPHKRSDLAVSWTQRWQELTRWKGEVHLVGALPENVRFPQRPDWITHVRLDDAKYQPLLSTARAVLYFSEYEGFGMPPVEATIAGACPVFSDLPVTREVMGEAGFCFQNDNFESFSHAMTNAFAVDGATIARWRTELLSRHSWASATARIVSALGSA